MRLKKFLFLVVCIISLSACTTPPASPGLPASSTPTSEQASSPQLSQTPIPTLSENPPAPGLPDLAWSGMPDLQPLAPIVGDKFHIKQNWRNNGSVAIVSEFDIKLEIKRGNINVFDEYIKVSQPVKPWEERIFDITPGYTISESGSYNIVLTLDGKSVLSESRKDNNITQSDMVEIPVLSQVPTFSKDPDTAAIVQAAIDIEQNRKGDVTLIVVDSARQPRSGLIVEYTQITHTFLFGVFEPSEDKRIWSLMKEAGVNYVPVWFGWSVIEPALGTYNLGVQLTAILRKYQYVGMATCLIFLMPFATPDYVLQLSYDQYKNAIYPHFYKAVSAYKQEIKIWNVFNEPMLAHTNILGLTEEQTIEVIKEGVRAIRDADSEGRILINNAAPGGEHSGMYPYDFLQDAIHGGVDFDIVGLEFYYNAYTRDGLNSLFRCSLSSMGELIDKYSNLGKKIQITEISVPSESIGEGYWGQPWSQELQAEYLKEAYTIFFSKPEVEGISWLCATDKPSQVNPFIYHGALLDEQNQPKKSYYVLKTLIRNWTTTGTGLTDSKGKVSFRGFGGTYEVIITNPATELSMKQLIMVEEQQQNLCTIVFD